MKVYVIISYWNPNGYTEQGIESIWDNREDAEKELKRVFKRVELTTAEYVDGWEVETWELNNPVGTDERG